MPFGDSFLRDKPTFNLNLARRHLKAMPFEHVKLVFGMLRKPYMAHILLSFSSGDQWGLQGVAIQTVEGTGGGALRS